MSIVTDIIRADITRDLRAIAAAPDRDADRLAAGLTEKCQQLTQQLAPLRKRRPSTPVAVRRIVPSADLHDLVQAEQAVTGANYADALEQVTRNPGNHDAVAKYLAASRAPKARR